MNFPYFFSPLSNTKDIVSDNLSIVTVKYLLLFFIYSNSFIFHLRKHYASYKEKGGKSFMLIIKLFRN